MLFDPLSADTFEFNHTYMQLDADNVHLIVGDPDEVFWMASVTKPVSAWAVLVAVQEGKISLDDPAGPEGATIRHLLAHASGVPATPGAPLAEPGKRRIYSDYGFDLLGEAVSAKLGMPIHDWIRAAVLDPLGMDTTKIEGRIGRSGMTTLDSLAKFAQELLRPTLLGPELVTQATTPVFDGIPGILPGFGRQKNNTWGLGMEIRSDKSPHWTGHTFSPRTFGHFGIAGSFLWVDPDIGQAGVFLGEKEFSEEHAQVWPGLTDQMRAL
ncbi:MAG: beta-lactamase family protein [Actinomycetaceae bacterium]|nr:beta-lactamase family protein [Actinomycetaceae bacterium]